MPSCLFASWRLVRGATREAVAMFVDVTIRSPDSGVPPEMVRGEVPDSVGAGCPLAVTPVMHYDHAAKEWRQVSEWWMITHRPTGFHLGHQKEWPSPESAMRVLLACDPTFAAWPLAIGGTTDSATIACKYKFRVALEAGK